MRPLIVCLPALAVLALLGGCDKQKPAQPQAEAEAAEPIGRVDISHRGEAMPAVPFLGPDGAPATLTGFRGRPLLVNLWATWCGPCLLELPSLDKLAQREGDALQVVTLSQDMAGRESRRCRRSIPSPGARRAASS